MVFGNLYDTTHINVNIGDYLQFIAINNIYSHMGIPENNIYYIDFPDVTGYRGEQMVLPINFSIHSFIQNGEIAISPCITPIFIAMQLDTVNASLDFDKLLSNPKNQFYLLKYSPIGCRDIVTFRYLSKYGIPAYVNGCMTATLPRYTGKKGSKVIFADAPEALLQYVPDIVLRQHCEVTTQQFHLSQQEVSDFRKTYSFVKSKYNYYCKNAKLIITSRLHVALPCTAFGIPVIFAKDCIDARMDFVGKYLPIYDLEKYSEINWEPIVPDYEAHKQKLISFAARRIQDTADYMQHKNECTSMFLTESQLLKKYVDPHQSFHKNGFRFECWAKEHWNTGATRYALWGVSESTAAYWTELIQTKYPNAELVAIFDQYKRGCVLGIELEKPDRIENLPEDVAVIVCAVSATSAARQMFKCLGWGAERYCITSDCFITQDEL